MAERVPRGCVSDPWMGGCYMAEHEPHRYVGASWLGAIGPWLVHTL